MANSSKQNDPRFWKLWRKSGAVSDLSESTFTERVASKQFVLGEGTLDEMHQFVESLPTYKSPRYAVVQYMQVSGGRTNWYFEKLNMHEFKELARTRVCPLMPLPFNGLLEQIAHGILENHTIESLERKGLVEYGIDHAPTFQTRTELANVSTYTVVGVSYKYKKLKFKKPDLNKKFERFAPKLFLPEPC